MSKQKTAYPVRTALVASALTLAVAGSFGAAPASARTINIMETGSSLLYPLFNIWVPAYTHSHPNVRINTQSTGSGTGISEAVSGIAQIGASDAYMSNTQIRQNPNILNIPLAISAQTVNYNIPGLNDLHLKLSGPVLAGIYDNQIQYWNAPAIQHLNPGVPLPHHRITPIHRTDGSGDTFIFTQYLSFSTPYWNSHVAYGTTVSWPAVPGSLGALGNPGMVQSVAQTPYSIAYIGVSFANEVKDAHLGTARLENRAGHFMLPTKATIMAAAARLGSKTPADERISLIFAPGAHSYPIINYEYAIVSDHQKDAEMGTAVRELLTWTINRHEGNAERYLRQVHFVALPARISALSRKQIAKIR
ncbi:MAG TPA: phosphate ABC transporter substrate-binding protein PstS [Acidiferrobacter sp.]|nr:phosphate ABC transporter substrate-binding protein PstS [Acidiferrobacter sp.]